MGSDEIESSNQPLKTVTIEAGNYLEFEAEGDMPVANYGFPLLQCLWTT